MLLVAGCSAAPRCKAGFIGDPDRAPEVKLLITDGEAPQRELAAGEAVPLEPPPQGGYVVYVGAAARNLDACGVVLRGALRDSSTGDELGFDARLTTLVAGADGWGRSDASSLANLSNVNVCPDYAPTDRHGQRFTLEMKVVDHAQRSATAALPAVPTCALADARAQALCVCTCSANWAFGKCDPNRDLATADQ